jgi:AcrR family transcriptional regulator
MQTVQPQTLPSPAQPTEPEALDQTRDIPTEVKDAGLVAKRRRQIVDAAVQLFIDKGFHKTTTREMAKAAGFSIGTLYEYVASKEDVLYLVCQAIHLEMEQRLKERLKFAGTAAAALAAAIEVYFEVCDQMSDHILLIYQETKSLPKESMRFVLAHEERITAIFADLLARGVGDYSLKPLDRAQIELMAHDIAVLGHMWTFRRWALGPRFTLEQYTELQRSLILGELT